MAHYQSMKEVDWGTPVNICAAARNFMGSIDLDPCSSLERNLIVHAERVLGLPDVDPEIGIPVEWGDARRIFINPPGGVFRGRPINALFWDALGGQIEEVSRGAFVWVAYNINQLQTLQVVNAHLLRQCCVCIPAKRVSYLDRYRTPRSGTPSASAILGFAWGERQSEQAEHWSYRFRLAFESIGAVWQP